MRDLYLREKDIDMIKFKDLPIATGKSKTYAGIGHRDLGGFREPNTNEPVENVMSWIAGELEKFGYTLNSGGAKGADAAFEYGVKSPAHKNIFTPADATETTRSIAQELHPAHERLQGHALDLYARNTNQVFGRNLACTIDFVVCYTKDGCETATTRSRESGGTGQAIEMADRKGAKVFNMKNPDWFKRLKKYLVNEAGIAPADALDFPKTFAKVPRNLVDFTPQKPAANAKPTPKMSDKQIRSLMKAMIR